MKKGFTLIELLAVIIILAVISLIAVPAVIDVIKDAKTSANTSTAYGIIDSAKLYLTESSFDETKKAEITNLDNLYDKVTFSGIKPTGGRLYINSNGLTAMSVVIDNKCYKKEFTGKLEVTDGDTCDLGYVGNDSISPTVTFSLVGNPLNSNGWAKENFYVSISVIDSDSGGYSYDWCSGTSNCTPTTTVEKSTNATLISLESSNNIICVIGKDAAGNVSETTCSGAYKLDKTNPSFSGIEDKTIMKNEVVDLSFGVTVNDTTSGIDGSYSYNPTIINTSVAGTTNVEYSVTDLAGNTNTITRKVVVDALSPTVTYTIQGTPMNANGWANSNFYVKADINDQSGLGIKSAKWCSTTSNTCAPNADMVGISMTPLISTESNNNRICIEATDNNNKTSEVLCSDSYKLDKTSPTVGTINLVGTMGSNNWYTTNVNITKNDGTDALSGHSSSIIDITSITSNTTGTLVTLTTTDLAGNVSTTNTTVKVDKNNPTITANSGTVTITVGDSNVVSSYFTTTYGISGTGTVLCTPVNTSTLTVGTPTLSCTATGVNGLTAMTTKQIVVNPACPYTINQQFVFDYTGAAQTFTAQWTGIYKLEVWGARGASTASGYGGYSVGTISLATGNTYYIYVGGTSTSMAGGFNGGGIGGNGTSNSEMGGGGGATHIAKRDGLLSTLSSYTSDILIVAGGGGGQAYNGDYYSTTRNGGSGGGYIGVTGGCGTSGSYCVTGGTQTYGGSGSGDGTGSFGKGADNSAPTSSYYGNMIYRGGGGGGGYYGGGAGKSAVYEYLSLISGGSGGSGYIGGVLSNATYGVTKAMYCYNCTTSTDTNTLTYTTTNSSATATSNYAKSGNGYARITYLGN